MNLVEHYILKIISEKKIILNNKEFILAKIKSDSYGTVEVQEVLETEDRFNKIKKQGYYLA